MVNDCFWKNSVCREETKVSNVSDILPFKEMECTIKLDAVDYMDAIGSFYHDVSLHLDSGETIKDSLPF